MQIGGFQKFSLIDYPGKVSCVIFTQGCNFNCVYCHNRELIGRNGYAIAPSEIFNFLEQRKGKIDAVVITGGEPTLHPDLIEFIKQIKDLGYLVKLDTNGSNPQLLKGIDVDFIAMDVKAPTGKYSMIANAKINIDKIKESIKIIQSSGISYEFRTTVPKSLLTETDITEIRKLISNAPLKLQQCNEEFLIDSVVT